MTHGAPKIPGIASPSPALTGRIRVPGDKSISHRALLCGLLADGETTIAGLLESEDIMATANAVRALGGHAERTEDGLWRVTGSGIGCLKTPEAPIDFGNAGTGVRLTLGAIAGHPVTARCDGDGSLRKRPMRRVLDPLTRMGARVDPEGANTLPFALTGTNGPIPITYELPVPSAQVKSAILICGLTSPGTVTVIEKEATRDHTERMLKAFGAAIEITEEAEQRRVISLAGQTRLTGQHVTVPGDPSSSAFSIVAAILVPGSDVTVENVLLNETRTGFLTTLREMGADITVVNERLSGGEPVGDVHVRASALKGVEIPPERAPSMIDEYPVISVAAAFAEGRTVMHGLAELRVKESDRLAAVSDGLAANGVTHETGPDWLTIEGQDAVEGGGTVQTHLDHRIAMAFLVMGLVSKKPVSVDDAAIIATSYPEFVPDMTAIGAKIGLRG